MKTFGGVELQLHAFLTSALMEASAALHPGNEPPVRLGLGDWGGSRAGMDAVAKRQKKSTSAGNRTPIVQPTA